MIKLSRGHVLPFLWIATIGSGWYGFHELSPSAPTLSNLYLTLQLFGLNGSFTDEALPIGVEVARFAAPALTIYTVILAFAGSFWKVARKLKARHLWRRHVVVYGAGNIGIAITKNLLDSGERVIMVGTDAPDEHACSIASQIGAVIIPASATEQDTLKHVNLKHASHMIVATGSDAQNIEVLRALDRHPGITNLTTHLQIQDPALAACLEMNADFLRSSDNSPPVRLLSAHQIAVRQLFQDHPLDQVAQIHGAETLHLVIIGFGQMGQHILLEALRLYSSEVNTPVAVSVVDREATKAWREFTARHKGVEMLCKVSLSDVDVITDLQMISSILKANGPISAWYICLNDDNVSVREALGLRQYSLQLTDSNAPIYVRLRESPGFERLFRQSSTGLNPKTRIFTFGALRESFTCQILLDESLDRLARCFHESYLNLLDGSSVIGAAQQPWRLLADLYRRSSRYAADHAQVKLRSIDARMTSPSQEAAASFTFTSEEVSRLAMSEHARWCAERRLDGWEYSRVRVDAVKLHTKLIPWEDLDQGVKQQNFDFIKGLPYIAMSAGMEIKRNLVVGVTGHRSYSEPENTRDKVRCRLQELVADNPGHQLVLLSALAAGADQEVARLALDEFGAELWAIAPFPLDLYQSDFSISDNAALFELLDQATNFYEMPLRFGSSTEVANDLEVRNHQYALAGAYIVQRAHHIIALWDGLEAKGVGGTADVVSWAQSGRVPYKYLFPRLTDRPRPKVSIVSVNR